MPSTPSSSGIWASSLGTEHCRTTPAGSSGASPTKRYGLKSFAIAVAERATGKRIDPDSLGGETGWIDYFGPPGLVKTIHYSDVRQGKTKPGEFRDKIVVIGATAPVLQDVHGTPTSGDGVMSGPEIQATAIATALEGFPLQDSPAGLDIALIVLLALVPAAVGFRASALPAIAIALGIGAVYAVVTQLAFNSGTILSFVYPLTALFVSAVGALAVHYLTEAFERERTRELFSRFVPESVVGEVLKQAGGVRLGGVVSRGDRDVQRPPGLHLVRGIVRPGPRDRDPQPLSDRDGGRRHPAPRRHPRGLHGRRDHGRLRCADPDRRSRGQGAGGSPRQAARARPSSTSGCTRRWGSTSPSRWASA